MEEEYNFQVLEKKWQQKWKNSLYFKINENADEKIYVLEMLPYPSGKIHMGHVRNYTIGDVIARFLKQQGKNIFHPIGWDAFGLPAENAAIENNIHPAVWTHQNIQDMKKQLQKLGLSYDWETEIATCNPDYYQWNQWLFLEMFESGLIQKKMGKVNYCPHCETVLANEQVIHGACWRCQSIVEQKELSQWYISITNFAKELLEDHHLLEKNWPSRVLNMQKSWIGGSQGTLITFDVENDSQQISVFTTRVETIFGVTYLALAYNHPFCASKRETLCLNEAIESFIQEMEKTTVADQISNTEKKGIFTGFYAQHPLTNTPIPIYLANFVIADYGAGAVMGVPAHDTRDFEFAQMYDLPIKYVITPLDKIGRENFQEPFVEKEGILINSFEFDKMSCDEATKAIQDKLIEISHGSITSEYKLRDWLISRQRYWGTPIPIIYCPNCGIIPLKKSSLPLLLPDDIEFKVGKNPLETSQQFIHTTCEKCGSSAQRETDTMDTFFDSSWYYLRYIDAHNTQAAFSPTKAQKLLPVDYYIGGIEHATMHLLYARFFYKFLHQKGLVPQLEPFTRLITQGMVNSFSYYCQNCKTYYPSSDIQEGKCPQKHHDIIQKMDKMSKSKKNGIEPEKLIQQYGVDAIRCFILFAAPIEKDLEWNEGGVIGSARFIKRFYHLCIQNQSIKKVLQIPDFHQLNAHHQSILSKYYETVIKVTEDNFQFHFNTSLATLMEFLNILTTFENQNLNDSATYKMMLVGFSQLLFSFAPHTAEECYSLIDGKANSIYDLSWPEVKKEWIQKKYTYTIQINGKTKAIITVNESLSQTSLKHYIEKHHPHIKIALQKQTIIKEIFVPEKLINFVIQ